jgi:hypothetical protein
VGHNLVPSATMTAQQPADYKLFCIVVGKTPFSVKISPHDTVDELKDAIKVKQSPDFDNLDANDLDLYLIDPAIEGSLTEKVKKLLAGDPPPLPLDPTQELSAVFLKPPVKGIGIVHILVQPPSPSEFLHADLRQITRLTKPSHVVGLGDKRSASTKLDDDPKPPTKRRRNGPRLSDEPTRLSGW